MAAEKLVSTELDFGVEPDIESEAELTGQSDTSMPLIGEWVDIITEGGFTSTPGICCRDLVGVLLMIRLHRATTVQ